LFDHLKKVVKAEGLNADDDALQLIARRAAGSVRDSQSLLDQMLAFAEGHLTAAKIHALLGTAGDDRVADLADAILRNDAKLAVEQIAAAAERGLQLGEFLDQLIEYWRGLMIVQTAGPDFPDLSGTPAFKERVVAHSRSATLDTILAGLDVLTTAKQKSRGSNHARVLLELAAVRLSRLGELLPVAALVDQMVNGAPATAAPAVRTGTISKPPEAAIAKSTVSNSAPPATGSTGLTSATIANVWPSVLEALGGMRSKRLEGAGLPAISGPNTLLFRFPAGYSKAQFDDANEERSLEALRTAIRKVTGSDWFVKLEPPPVGVVAPEAAVPMSRKKELLAGALGKFVTDKLGGHLVNEVDPEFGRAVAAANDSADEG
jgi:DNA polymerase III subunit gamma/tau